MQRIILSINILSMSLLLLMGCDQALLCEQTGGTVELRSCCESVGNFPNFCLVGPCTCLPEDSHKVIVCKCPEGFCWNGADEGGCVAINSDIVEEDCQTELDACLMGCEEWSPDSRYICNDNCVFDYYYNCLPTCEAG